jgi:hypothetical protein
LRDAEGGNGSIPTRLTFPTSLPAVAPALLRILPSRLHYVATLRPQALSLLSFICSRALAPERS